MARPSMQDKVKEMLQEADLKTRKTTNVTSTQRTTEVVAERTFDTDNNPFIKIIFDPALSQEEKRDAIAKLLTYDTEKTREENEQSLKLFDDFKSYLQYERQKMAQRIIEMSDTEAFAEMHTMYQEINASIKEFDDSLKPLADILDAVHKLRTQGGGETTLDIFKEIQEDKIAAVKRAEEIKSDEEKLAALRGRIDEQDRSIARLREKKSLPIIGRSVFGLGGISDETKGEIAAAEVDKGKLEEERKALIEKIEMLRSTPANESKFQQWAFEKEKLRELLDISSDEHRERQKRLVASAQGFVETTDTRVTQVLEHFGKMSEQIGTLNDANQGIQVIYAIVTEASTNAISTTKEKHTELDKEVEGETPITKMQRTTKKQNIEDFLANMGSTTQDTVKTYADLTEQGARIQTMKTANRDQIHKARELQSTGVAGVADGLSSLLTTVSAAALNESAEMAGATIGLMNDRTDEKNMQESLRQAIGVKDQANQIEKAIDSLAAYRDTAAAVTETTRENLQHVNDAQTRLKALISEAQLQISQTVGVHAELAQGKTPPAAATTPTSAPAAAAPASSGATKRPSLGDLAPK